MALESWIESANSETTDFPLENLPYGVFSSVGEGPRCGVAIGDVVLDLGVLEREQLLDLGGGVFSAASLNAFMAKGPSSWRNVRDCLTELLRVGGNPALERHPRLREAAIFPADSVTMHLPFRVSEYTDFYASRQHAFNVGTMFRGPENALPPNWLHIPIGYNGRASTVVVSGTDVRRPLGQLKAPDAEAPSFGACRRLDIELEMGAVVGLPSEMGCPMTVAEANDMIFGYVLLNDWSARDIQAWEYQPLGPFQAKAFATSISPWVVTQEALKPYRVSTPQREKSLLPYLHEPSAMLYDIALEVDLRPSNATRVTTIARTNYRHMYYSAAQQLAHHASSGCKMNTGDLLGSGTISGPEKNEFGSLLELTWGGKAPITLDSGEVRTFLEDGDVVTLRGWAGGGNGRARIGFGECVGTILPALEKRKTW